MKLDQDVLEALRQRNDLEKNDKSMDDQFKSMSKEKVFR